MSKIISFYSYKGGVGRTMALANIGVLLARQGKKVLLMDFDLEAPGLDLYFQNMCSDHMSEDRGMIHLLMEACSNSATDWRFHLEKLNIQTQNTTPSETISLYLIPSGVTSSTYADQVQNFSWVKFMRGDGGGILERWRKEWKTEFDYILIDSRTGLTDTGGICTILLPDVLAFVFMTNEQSFERAANIILNAQKERLILSVSRPQLTVLPIPSRFDGREELDLTNDWLDRFSSRLKPFYDLNRTNLPPA